MTDQTLKFQLRQWLGQPQRLECFATGLSFHNSDEGLTSTIKLLSDSFDRVQGPLELNRDDDDGLESATDAYVQENIPLKRSHNDSQGLESQTGVFDELAKMMEPVRGSSDFGHSRVRIVLQWELPFCLSNYYPTGTKIGDVMTITGTSQEAYADSCRKYVERLLPEHSELLLKLLEGRYFQSILSAFFNSL